MLDPGRHNGRWNALIKSFCATPEGGDFAPAPERESQASAPYDNGFVWRNEQFSFLPNVN